MSEENLLRDYFKCKGHKINISFDSIDKHQSPRGKIILPDNTNLFWKSSRKGDNFENEKEILIKLNGDCVPYFYDIITYDNKQIIITEYIPYPTFSSLNINDIKIYNKLVIENYKRLNKLYDYNHEDPHQKNVLIDIKNNLIWFVDNTSAYIDKNNYIKHILEIYN
jgi:hypothetical protein